MRPVTLYSWGWSFLPKKAVGHKVRELDKIALVRLLKLRIFYDLLQRNVLGRRAILPSPVLAGYVIVNPHSAYEGNVLIFLSFVTNQMSKAVSSLHGSINSVQEPLKRSVLIVFGVAHIEDRHATVLQPICDLESCVENLRPFVPGKPANDTSRSSTGQEFSSVKLIIERNSMNVSKVLPPPLEAIKDFVPSITWHAEARKDVDWALG